MCPKASQDSLKVKDLKEGCGTSGDIFSVCTTRIMLQFFLVLQENYKL